MPYHACIYTGYTFCHNLCPQLANVFGLNYPIPLLFDLLWHFGRRRERIRQWVGFFHLSTTMLWIPFLEEPVFLEIWAFSFVEPGLTNHQYYSFLLMPLVSDGVTSSYWCTLLDSWQVFWEIWKLSTFLKESLHFSFSAIRSGLFLARFLTYTRTISVFYILRHTRGRKQLLANQANG